VNVFESTLGNSPLSIALHLGVIVLLNGDLVAVDSNNPRDMAITTTTLVGLGDAARLGIVIDLDADLLRCIIPLERVAPDAALVPVGELDAQTLVDAPRDERGALALEVIPRIHAAAAALVWVVVGHRAGNANAISGAGTRAGARARALGGDITIGAGLDIVIGHIAAVRGLVPKLIAVDAGASGLAGDLDIGALGVGLFDRVAGARTRAAVDIVARDPITLDKAGEGQGLKEARDDGELHR